MHGATKLQELSGWILPDSSWRPVREWWHIAALFDLRDEGHPSLQCEESRTILGSGDEASIRDLAARKGFAKVSRCILDAYHLTDQQLSKLQSLLQICDLESELTLLLEGGAQRNMAIGRLLKLKRASHLFTIVEASPNAGRRA